MGKISTVKNKKKKKLINRKGFTLIELLAVIAILSLVVTIVIYSATHVVKNSKEKSYQVTINNIQTSASNYVLEDFENKPRIYSSGLDDDKIEFQCVTVKHLMDAGYFKSDILDSPIKEGKNVKPGDNIYIEYDPKIKAITKSILVYSGSGYEGLCEGINPGGEIEFGLDPGDDIWAKEKSVKVTYYLYDVPSGQLGNYNYKYDFYDVNGNRGVNEIDSFVSDKKEYSFASQINGTLYAEISGGYLESSITNILEIGKIDRGSPGGDIESSNNVADKQNVTLNIFDDISGIDKYYFGKLGCNSEEITWITDKKTNGNQSRVIQTIVDDSGTYNLCLVDKAGNTSKVSRIFYKTTLSVPVKYSSVSPSYVITPAGSTFTIPIPQVDNYYTFKGWHKSSDYGDTEITSYKPTGNSKLFANVVENKLVAGRVTINGNAIYGYTIGGSSSSTTPAADEYVGQWYVNNTNSNVGGTPIDGETGNKLLLDEELVGKYVYSVVTATKENYRSVSYASNPVFVSKRDVVVTANSKTKYYDGTALTDSGCTATNLAFGHTCTCQMTVNSKITNAGIMANTIRSVAVTKDSTNYNQYYNFQFIAGKLEVIDREVTVNYHAYGTEAAGVPLTDTFRVGNNYSIKDGSYFDEEGYTLSGWTTKSDGTDDGYGWTGWSGTWEFSKNEKGIKNDVLDLYAITIKNKVTVKYSVNGGTIKSPTTENGITSNWKTNDSGHIMRKKSGAANYSLYVEEMNYGGALSASGLANWDNGTFIRVTKDYNAAVEGAEWKCLSGNCKNTTYNDSTVYTASDFCDAKNGDCTVVLGVNWTPTKILFRYNANGGYMATTSNTHGSWSLNSDDMVMLNGKIYEQEYSSSAVKLRENGLANWDNSGAMNIFKTGHHANSGVEYGCLSGCDSYWKGFDDTTAYDISQFFTTKTCDPRYSNCVVVLGVSWVPNKATVRYKVNGGSIATTSNDGGTWSSNNDGYVTLNGNVYKETYSYGGKMDSSGFSNYNNSSYINISRTGYTTPSDYQWKCLSGNCTQTKYGQSYQYDTSSLCDVTNGDCTIDVGVNWTGRTYTITYVANGGYSAIANSYPSYCSSSYSVGGNHDITGSMAQQTCTYGSWCELRANNFSRKCHLFKGWTTRTDTYSTNYTGSITNASYANNEFFIDTDGFTYNKAGNLTLYAVWQSNHSFGSGVGNQLYSTDGLYWCGNYHNTNGAYAVYCSVCQMSAHHYNFCYKPGYEAEQAGKWCPCNFSATVGFNDHAKFGYSSYSKKNAADYVYKYGGLIEGNSSFGSATVSKNCNDH